MSGDEFGTTDDGRPVHRLELGRAPGPVLHLLTLGATVHRLEVTCGDGRRRNIVLGHPTPADYLASTDYIGGTIGRYANRIAAGSFPLGGAKVQLATHDRGNHLHGGPDGFDRRLWEVVERGPDHALLRLDSPDGDQGFPGALVADVRFEVTPSGVRIDVRATTDAATVVNLTSHAYFNLDGEGAGSIDDHELTVHGTAYTPVDRTGIPLGDHAPVAGTPFDFRRPTAIGHAVRRDHEQVAWARGIDHNLVLDGAGWRPVAALESRRTATRLTLHTDQPGLQVYTGNFLDGSRRSTDGGLYRQGDGIALEPQVFPDSPNHPEWPSALLLPGETYAAAMEWELTPVPDRR
ncbi:MAG: galactose mutarotase [Actinomycetota bacterium]|nr:galactose mutarotase [Actinomycetota bacterium]